MRAISIISLSLFLCSCATFAPEERSNEILALPDQFTMYDEGATTPDHWWETWNSAELNQLVSQALAGNLTLEQVYARLKQTHLLAIQTGTARYPALSFSGDTSTTYRHTKTDTNVNTTDTVAAKLSSFNTLISGSSMNNQTATTGLQQVITGLTDAQTRLGALESLLAKTPSNTAHATTKAYNIGLSTSYEVDLWGRINATHQAALLDVETSMEDVYSAMLSLSGSVVNQWLTILAANEELGIIEKQLKLNHDVLKLLELRYRRGMSSYLDVLQQRQVIAETETLIPSVKSKREVAIHDLALLLGKYPQEGVAISTEQLPQLPLAPVTGLPADLLAMRPDIRSAGLALRAADWRVAAARAERLPGLQLNATASYGAEDIALLFDNWMAMLAASVTGPIFDAGKRKAEVMRTRAVVDERLAQYKLTVITAVKEVEDALILEKNQGDYIDALMRQLESANTSYEQALERYKRGNETYLSVLTALSSIQMVERALVSAHFNQNLYRLQLHLALGGTWMPEEIQPMENF